MCRFRRSFRPKVIPQTIQAKGCSPVCLNMWTRKWSERKNRWSHRSHLNGRTFTRNYVIIFVIFFISGAYEIKIYSFWPKFRFLTKMFIFVHNFDCWPKFGFLNKNFYFWPKCYFGPKLRFVIKISIFHIDFLTQKIRISRKILC